MIKTISTIDELTALKASDIMTAPVQTVRLTDSVHDVARLFVDNSIGSAAVVDANGVPLGVITSSDLVRHECERSPFTVAEQDKNPDRAPGASEDVVKAGFHLEAEEVTLEHWMTPVLFDVHPSTVLPAIVKKMVKNGLHHIFVTEAADRTQIRGVITTFDILMVMQRMLNPADRPVLDVLPV